MSGVDLSFFDRVAPKVKDLRILVVGDTCLDMYPAYRPGRKIPGANRAFDIIYDGSARQERGMAAFVARQVVALGATTEVATSGVHYIQRIDDIVIRSTTQEPEEQQVILGIGGFNTPSAVIVADYNRGAVTPAVMRAVNAIGVPVYVDPGRDKRDDFYGRPFLTKRNRSERIACNKTATYEVMTAGEVGMWIYSNEGTEFIPSLSVDAIDSTGCGDVCIATIACFHAAGATVKESCMVASVAAGLKAARHGCVPVGIDEISDVFREWSECCCPGVACPKHGLRPGSSSAGY